MVAMLRPSGGLLAGALVGLTLLALTGGPLLAETPTPSAGMTPTSEHMGMMDMMGGATPGPAGTPTVDETHELMHRMMDAMHGAGTSDRMHEAMGPDGERMMEQCAAMMGMMAQMIGGDMSGMVGGQGMEGMMGMPTPTATPGP